MEGVIAGFGAALTPSNVAFVALGVLLGYVVGVLPGFNRPTALALAVPVTFYMGPVSGIAFLIGISKGSATGGAVSAILLNTPGEASSAATCLDGYPLARKGRARAALLIALIASVFGDIFATLVLIALAQPLSRLALLIGPVEICAVLLFALTFIASLSGASLLKGMISGFLGILLGTVGLDPETGTSRLTFGQADLFDGLPLMTIAIGLLALSEMVVQMEERGKDQVLQSADLAGSDRLRADELRACTPVILRSSLLGTMLGVIPGLGASVASFLAYSWARNASSTPERFGQGVLEGVAAAEAADNAVVPAGLIPLFALGIPGGIAAALIIGAFTVHGITPGPLMFQRHAHVLNGIYASMLLAGVLMFVFGYFGSGLFARLARLPQSVIVATVVFLCVAGAYVEGGTMFGVYLVLGFAVLGWLLRKFDFSYVTFLIGFVLTPILELSLRQALILTDRNPYALINHPIALAVLAATVLAVWRLVRRRNVVDPTTT
jgi:putative tricarboxylic transport membrane protein